MTRTRSADAATTTMISLVGSLADNKSALGRRYGEWAVSAPTIESAVAAAAMAQDELGHARSTYPVLAKLGVTRDDETLDGGHPLHSIAHELPDWASFIAANLVVDGILTTFVASTRESSIEPLAQRARKILQEEGAHRRHAEAWARRLARAGGSVHELLARRIAEMWTDAARWPGPDDRPGYSDAIELGMVSEGPDAIRDRVRSWLTDLLEAEGVEVTLDDPTGLGEERGGEVTPAPPPCPFCLSADVEVVSTFGGQIITSQLRCRSCNTYFEAVREDFDAPRRPELNG